MRKRIIVIGLMVVALGVLAEPTTNGVATVVEVTSSGDPWTIQRLQNEFCGEDVWEPFNRTMFSIFDWCMDYVADPFCYLYSSIVPKPLIKGIDNFCFNLEEPRCIFANLFMGEWAPAWDETRRFAINSTLGVGGLFDPAEDWFYIFRSNASLSDTFARWGIPSGPPLALPFMPRSSLRGHVGYVLDYGFDIKTYVDLFVPSSIYIGYTWLLVPNKAPVWRTRWENLFAHAEDHYSVYMPVASALNDFNLRQFSWRYYEGAYNRSYARMKAKELPEGSAARQEMEAQAETYVHDVHPPVHASAAKPGGLKGEWREIPGYAPRGACLDSLRALCFSPLGDNDFWWERRSIWNRDFSKGIEEREIVISNGLPKAVYSFVAAPEPKEGSVRREKLAIVLPGIGAGRTASEVVAMAEFLNQHGYAVVMCDSVFHWEHMRSVNEGLLPGCLTKDMRRYAAYLAKVVADLKASGRVKDPDVRVLGWSMGGLTTAYLASFDDADELPLRVGRFVAINPPTSYESAMRNFSSVLQDSCNWTKADARRMFAEVAPSLYGWAAQDHPRFDPAQPPTDIIGDPWNYAPNLTEAQATFLLGETMGLTFPALVAERHKIAPFPWIASELTWFHRRDFYDEIGSVSMDEYITTYVPTCYEGITGDEMIEMANIRTLEAGLRRNARLSVIHTWNDPLENDDDRRYLDGLFGKRITWFADGGHCGLFYTKPFQDELLRRLEE